MEMTLLLAQSGQPFTLWSKPARWTLSWPGIHATGRQKFAKDRKRKTGPCFKGSVLSTGGPCFWGRTKKIRVSKLLVGIFFEYCPIGK